MKVLAVIPARGGSKRLPGKNVRTVGGRPLVAWSIDAARGSQRVDQVVVSTDSPAIADVARAHGALVHDRLPEHAHDTARIDNALEHVLLQMRRRGDDLPELVVTLQPTCPIRRPGLVDDAIRLLRDTDADTVFTAYRDPLCFMFVNDRPSAEFADYAAWRPLGGRWVQEQEMRPEDYGWRFDGSVVVTRTDVLLQTHRRVAGRLQVLPNERSVDIDVERDLVIADTLLSTSLRASA